ncbi:Fe-S cluster assembly protein SufB [Candidatus Saccharibacteria bacterium]|nr:Fe-S cluster assembly protein SufB [Candidatus Saccharibacteria bacterium]
MNRGVSYKGLDKTLILELSQRKKEPKWMRDLRLSGLKYWEELEMPKWAPKVFDKGEEWLDISRIEMYVKPSVEMVSSWDKVPVEIRKTFDELGIPEAEKEGLAGVGAQYDSEVIYHNLKEKVKKTGVIYLPMEEAVKSSEEIRFKGKKQTVSELVREYFMKLVPENDHKFAALHAAVWSGGSFVYIPKNSEVEIPLQSYYRLNAPGSGQFEHTLIIVDEGASFHFIEGCSAPKYNVANLHAGTVEIYVSKNAKMKFSTVESWSKNMYNLNTKRAIVEEGGEIEWISGSFGSKVTMLYPMTILNGTGAKCKYTGVTFAGENQIIDNGAKVVHAAPDTYSILNTKSLSKGNGISVSRMLAKITPKAKGAKTFMDCKSLILNEGAKAEAIPEVKVGCMEAEAAHEASVGKISEEALFYLQSRGLSEEAARALIVRGFTSGISKELPVEYAMEMNNLIKMEMEGTA